MQTHIALGLDTGSVEESDGASTIIEVGVTEHAQKEEIQQLQNEIKGLQAELENCRKTATNDLHQKDIAIIKIGETLKICSNEKDRYESIIGTKDEELKACNDRIAAMETDRKRLQECEREKADLEELAEARLKTCEAMQTENKDLKATLEGNLETCNTAMKTADDNLKKCNEELERMKTQSSELESMQTENNALKRKADTMQAEIDENATFKEECENNISAMQTENAGLKELAELEKQRNEEDIQELQAEKQRLERLNAALVERMKTCEDLESILAKREMTEHHLGAENDELKTKLQACVAGLEQCEKDRAATVTSLGEANKRESEARSLLEELGQQLRSPYMRQEPPPEVEEETPERTTSPAWQGMLVVMVVYAVVSLTSLAL